MATYHENHPYNPMEEIEEEKKSNKKKIQEVDPYAVRERNDTGPFAKSKEVQESTLKKK